MSHRGQTLGRYRVAVSVPDREQTSDTVKQKQDDPAPPQLDSPVPPQAPFLFMVIPEVKVAIKQLLVEIRGIQL